MNDMIGTHFLVTLPHWVFKKVAKHSVEKLAGRLRQAPPGGVQRRVLCGLGLAVYIFNIILQFCAGLLWLAPAVLRACPSRSALLASFSTRRSTPQASCSASPAPSCNVASTSRAVVLPVNLDGFGRCQRGLDGPLRPLALHGRHCQVHHRWPVRCVRGYCGCVHRPAIRHSYIGGRLSRAPGKSGGGRATRRMAPYAQVGAWSVSAAPWLCRFGSPRLQRERWRRVLSAARSAARLRTVGPTLGGCTFWVSVVRAAPRRSGPPFGADAPGVWGGSLGTLRLPGGVRRH